MFDMSSWFQLVLEIILDVCRLSGRRLAQPLLTAVCLTGAYTAIHVTQEKSVYAGLRSAFFDSEADRQERRRIEDQATLQVELRQFVAANKLINQLLETVMVHAPGASRVSLGVIHNGVTGINGAGLLRYDDTNSVAAQGRLGIPVVTNQPLSDWGDVLPALMAGECAFHPTRDLQGTSLRTRFESYGVAKLLVCPASDVQGKMVGAIFVMWDAVDPPSATLDIKALMQTAKHQGAQIATALDLRGPASIIPTLMGN